MTKPTGNPVGRPKTKEYSTLLARVPQDLVDRVKRYASVHRSTIAELIRDGLEWRITEGDPRSAFLYDMNLNEYSSNTETQAALEGMDLTPDMVDADALDASAVVPVPLEPSGPTDGSLETVRPCGHPQTRWNPKGRVCKDCEAAKAKAKRAAAKAKR
jgi:hypothetical protein